jgi:hypothetical protein
MLGKKALSATAAAVEAEGQTLFIGNAGGGTAGFNSYSFVVPDGVTEISAVCVGPGARGTRSDSFANGGGGGDLRYSSSIAVTSGETLTVEVGQGIAEGPTTTNGGPTRILRGATVLLAASARRDASSSTISGNIGGGDGGEGGTRSSTTAGGGGGAGGYSGSGGSGRNADSTATAPASGGGGAYGGDRSTGRAIDGGGVGLMGAGPTGSEFATTTYNTARNVVGSYGYASYARPNNAGFGAGGGGNDSASGAAGASGPGACRIVWGGGRSYPSDVANHLPLPAAASQIELRLYGAVGSMYLCMLSVKDSSNNDFFRSLTPVTGTSSSSFSSISAGQFTLKSLNTALSTDLANLQLTNRTTAYEEYFPPTGTLSPMDYISIFIKPSSAKVIGSVTLDSANSNTLGYVYPVAGIAIIADGVNITNGIACLRGDYVWNGTVETLNQTITFA